MGFTREFALTEQEIDVRQKRLLEKLDERDSKAAKVKVDTEMGKKQVAGLESDIGILRLELRDKKILVNCEVVYNSPVRGLKKIIRTDTKEEFTENMSTPEMEKFEQENLPFAEIDKSEIVPVNPDAEVKEPKVLKLFRPADSSELWAHYSFEELKAAFIEEYAIEEEGLRRFEELDFIEVDKALLEKGTAEIDGVKFTFMELLSGATEPSRWEF